MKSEFQFILKKEDLDRAPVTLHIEANEKSRNALARRFDLIALDRLIADLTVESRGEGVRVAGTFEADAVQRCVLSLVPVSATIGEDFAVLLLPTAALVDEEGEAEVDAELDEDVDALEGDSVDIGEIVAQSLALALDPYPRAPGSDSISGSYGSVCDSGSGERDTPFAVLEKLRNKT